MRIFRICLSFCVVAVMMACFAVPQFVSASSVEEGVVNNDNGYNVEPVCPGYPYCPYYPGPGHPGYADCPYYFDCPGYPHCPYYIGEGNGATYVFLTIAVWFLIVSTLVSLALNIILILRQD